MIRLLNIELKKIVNNKTFWILLGLYILVIATVYWGIQAAINNTVKDVGENTQLNVPIPEITLYAFPDIWHNLTFISGYLKLILAIIVIIFVTNEYTFRTIRQNIITGLSRQEFLISKVLFIASLASIGTLFLFINGIILGLLNSEAITFGLIFKKSYFIFGYFLELFAFMSFAMLLSFLIRKSGLTLGILFLYYYIIEPILNYKLPNDLGDYLPLQSIANLIDIPNTAIMKMVGVNFKENIEFSDIALTIAYTILFIYASYLVLRKRDL